MLLTIPTLSRFTHKAKGKLCFVCVCLLLRLSFRLHRAIVYTCAHRLSYGYIYVAGAYQPFIFFFLLTRLSTGSSSRSSGTFNPLCRQGLKVPKEPWVYSCAEPMLGKFVYISIQRKATLTLCEVEVFVNSKCSILRKINFLFLSLN